LAGVTAAATIATVAAASAARAAAAAGWAAAAGGVRMRQSSVSMQQQHDKIFEQVSHRSEISHIILSILYQINFDYADFTKIHVIEALGTVNLS
jgi:hypothetical protein